MMMTGSLYINASDRLNIIYSILSLPYEVITKKRPVSISISRPIPEHDQGPAHMM